MNLDNMGWARGGEELELEEDSRWSWAAARRPSERPAELVLTKEDSMMESSCGAIVRVKGVGVGSEGMSEWGCLVAELGVYVGEAAWCTKFRLARGGLEGMMLESPCIVLLYSVTSSISFKDRS